MNRQPTDPFGSSGAAQSASAAVGARGAQSPAVSTLHQALEEVIGCEEAAALDPSRGLAGLLQQLESRWGQQSGRGIQLRVGAASFHRIVRRVGLQAGLTLPAFRMLPLPLRLWQGLLAFRGLLSDFGGRGIRVEEQESRLFWRLQECPLCAGRQALEPMCFFMLGMLREAMNWLSGGKTFRIQEIACRARGDEDCIFLIDPAPLDL